MSIPRVGLVIPTYQNAEQAVRAMESARQVGGTSEVRVVVVDDGSGRTDLATLRRAAAHLDCTVIERERNGGVSAARNEGLRHINSPFVCFLDSDDIICADFVHEALRLLATDQSAVGAEGHTEIRTRNDPASGVEFTSFRSPELARRGRSALLRFEIWAPFPSFVFRTDAAKAVGFDEGLRSYNDWDFLVRISELGALREVPRVASVVNRDGHDRHISSGSTHLGALLRLHSKHHIESEPPATRFAWARKTFLVAARNQEWDIAGSNLELMWQLRRGQRSSIPMLYPLSRVVGTRTILRGLALRGVLR